MAEAVGLLSQSAKTHSHHSVTVIQHICLQLFIGMLQRGTVAKVIWIMQNDYWGMYTGEILNHVTSNLVVYSSLVYWENTGELF